MAEIVDPGVTAPQRPTLARVDVLSEAKDVLDNVSDDEVANAWIEDETGRLTVGVTDGANTTQIKADLTKQGIHSFELEPVQYSQQELDDIVEGVYGKPGLGDISSATHDYASNDVVLTSRVPVTDELREVVFATYGDAAVIASEPLKVEPASRDADTSPFYTGAWIGNTNAAGAHCTVGFSWVNPLGDPRMVTAGHCYPVGSNDSVATNYGAGSYTYRMGHAFSSTVDSRGTVGSDGDLVMIDTTTAANGDALNRSGAPRMWTEGARSNTILG